MSARSKGAAGDEEERALLVSPETAVLAKTGAILRFKRVANDVAVTRHAVRVGAFVVLEGQSDLHRRAGRQADPSQIRTDERLLNPVLSCQKT